MEMEEDLCCVGEESKVVGEVRSGKGKIGCKMKVVKTSWVM